MEMDKPQLDAGCSWETLLCSLSLRTPKGGNIPTG